MAVLALGVVFLLSKWKEASDHGGQLPRKPFRIAGNLYYVGTRDVTSFLLTSPQVHVLIDGGYPGTAPMILKSIATLGFNIRAVKILLNSHAHFDHAGGLAALQQASGAKLWANEQDAHILESGGATDPTSGSFRVLAHLGLVYPPPRVDYRFQDGAQIRLGPILLTAHPEPGHTPGCTTWGFPVQDKGRELLAVLATDMVVLPTASLVAPEAYPGIRAEFEHSFNVLRSPPTDIT
ncbi:metallo-beta-lactamase [Hymenobacter taeanensis]|uniref:Metallo-beta-lactamase n=1 Tax=Hymenobacter taeanensis TaxID=2735321 RepID=A0A6M6BH70_9BACT|nr:MULTISPECIES: metallo-beta-lactamase [Hymenobacter]QJX47332.1 metallo-beta-lactamase [Hymenobacter taeanensis]UOQ79330.1 metallo-beta-lactamase [Hymenobacter sp. 5414T-23]